MTPTQPQRSRPLRMSAEHSVLLLIDFQERLMPAIDRGDDVLATASFLGQVARNLEVTTVGTAQNPGRLGPNLPPVAEYLDLVVDKMAFGACEDGLIDALAPLDPSHEQRDVVIAGCEAHVCLLSTALGLLETGRRVWVAADACGSRHETDRDVAMDRLRQAGATIVTAEMVAFEWLNTAGNDHFKTVSKLVKER
ncbi:MAG: isochorismatase family protein [Micrococcales bacterium]|nr:isochorismatase family protein [Micrococcales bacterium]